MSASRLWLVLGATWLLAGPVAADEPPAAQPSATQADVQSVDHDWDDVHRLMRQGAYRDALTVLDRIGPQTPDDPRVELYRTMCAQRLQASDAVTAVPPEELRALKRRLKEEERQQKRQEIRQHRLEQRLRREQDAWDRDLRNLQAAAKRDKERQRGKTRQEPEPQPSAPQPDQRVRAAEPEPPTIAPTAAAPEATTPASEPAAPPAADEPARDDTQPSPQPKPAAGDVQVDAQQMSVAPDRNLAIAQGDVRVTFGDAVLWCDRVTVFTDTGDVYAEGQVRLRDGAQSFRAELLHYNMRTKKGRFLQGTVATPPWYEHGRTVEHLAEGVFRVTPGYLTSCPYDPPHYRFAGRSATVFAGDRLARARNVALFVDRLPVFYLPFVSFSENRSPFFIIPGKRKPWGFFALGGYRYELPTASHHHGTVQLDWRENFGIGTGLQHQFESARWGEALAKVYYNDEGNREELASSLPKGADAQRYRVLWRHRWQPMEDTTMMTDLQKYSDENFRKDFLYREEYIHEDNVPSDNYVSTVTNTAHYTLSSLIRKRLNRFDTATEALPQVTLDARQQRLGDTRLFSLSRMDVANLELKERHSEQDADAVRADWFQQFSYAAPWLRPVEITPRAGVRQTYFTKDIQGSTREGERDVISGQFTTGFDASLKLFRLFDVQRNVAGLDLHRLRHVVTPTVSYAYTHEPTIPNELLNFPTAGVPSNVVTYGIENKLQTKRPGLTGALSAVDLARFLITVPYTFHSSGADGGELGNWVFDLESTPWPSVRLESDLTVLSQINPLDPARDRRIASWNSDVYFVGGSGPKGKSRPRERYTAPVFRGYLPGPTGRLEFLPLGQWLVGFGHRYSPDDKTESVIQWDWRLSEKWEIGTFHRYTWKEVAGSGKRFNNVREFQYSLRRDLHDWIGEFVFRTDREYGEEVFFVLTLKAYPELPIEMETSYHQPKAGSQSSPFSPVQR